MNFSNALAARSVNPLRGLAAMVPAWAALAESLLAQAPDAPGRANDPLAVWWAFAGLAVFSAVVWTLFTFLAGESRRPSIHIVSVPPGDAPEEIRAAWVGLLLPIAGVGQDEHRGPSVLRLPGEAPAGPALYYVDASAALAELAIASPAAAEWYREHAPQVSADGYRFAFRAADVEPIGPHQLTPGDLVGAEMYDDGKNKRCARCGLIMPIVAVECERCHGVFELPEVEDERLSRETESDETAAK
ncbi:MAG TPA: hypothetical protein VGE52_03290 [Pirellulales bacterium]